MILQALANGSITFSKIFWTSHQAKRTNRLILLSKVILYINASLMTYAIENIFHPITDCYNLLTTFTSSLS